MTSQARGCRVCSPRGKYMARRGGSLVRAVREPPFRRDPSRQPGENVEAFGEVKDRAYLGQLYAYLLGHRKRVDLGLSGLEGPEMMVDFAAAYGAPLFRTVQAVALGQEVLKAPCAALERLSHRAIACRKLSARCAPMCPDAPVMDLAA
jgi:hypothetical protein